MTDLDVRFRSLDRIPAPLLWPEVIERANAVERPARHSLLLRLVPVLAPIAVLILLAVVIVSGLIGRQVGDDPPSPLPSVLEDGSRIDMLVVWENYSDQRYASWHERPGSASYWSVPPCSRTSQVLRLRTPSTVHFGVTSPSADPLTEGPGHPVLLDTAMLPGPPLDLLPISSAGVHTTGYLVSISTEAEVTVQPLSSMPDLGRMGGLCPEATYEWPEAWSGQPEEVRGRTPLPACGIDRRHSLEVLPQPGLDVAGRRCLLEAFTTGRAAEFVEIVDTAEGPVLTLTRVRTDGVIELLIHDTRTTSGWLTRTCTRLAPASEILEEEGMTVPPDIDETVVFMVAPETCSQPEGPSSAP